MSETPIQSVCSFPPPSCLQPTLYPHLLFIKIFHKCPGRGTMQEVEMLRKLINISATIDKFHTGAYIEAFSELTTYIYHRDVDLARKVIMHADNYVKGHLFDDSEPNNRHIAENVARVEKNLENDTELEDPALPADPVPEPPATEQEQNGAPLPIEPTTTQPSTQTMAPEENNTFPSVSVNKQLATHNILENDNTKYRYVTHSTSPAPIEEGRDEAPVYPCDKNGITATSAKNKDNQLINNELNQPTIATAYPISNFSNHVITKPKWENKSFIDLGANQVLGKG